MEAVDLKHRQRSIGHLTSDRESQFSPAADVFGRGYTSISNMATTAVMKPSSIFHNHQTSHAPPPYSHHKSAPNSAHSLSALISQSPNPFDSRRTSGDTKDSAGLRQSLPSIHEALADAPSTYSAAPVSHPYTPTYALSGSTPTNRSFPSDSTQYQPHLNSTQSRRNSPPQPVQPPPSSFPRSDPVPRTYPDPLRQPSSLRSAQPSHTQSSPLLRTSNQRQDADSRYYDRPGPPIGYGGAASDQYRGYPTAPTPTTAYPTQPNENPFSQRYAPGLEHVDDLTSKKGEPGYLRSGFTTNLKRTLDNWDEERSMRELNISANRLSQISENYLSVAQRWGNTPARGNPALVDLHTLRAEHEKIGHCIELVKTSLEEQEAIMADQQSREQTGKGPMHFDRDDYDGWNGDPKDQGMGGPGPNKRRGRAAPPGRCHSCNRAETPEWRRGPDGARTLCNACGLHYAKLTRKSGTKQGQNPGSSLRPKSMDEP